MLTYKKLRFTQTFPWDWFVAWYNKRLLQRLVTKVAWNIHLATGREVHVSEMFGSFVVFDSRDREDINKSGRTGKMNVYEAIRASIWNSTAHGAIIKRKSIIEYPVFRKNIINKKSRVQSNFVK